MQAVFPLKDLLAVLRSQRMRSVVFRWEEGMDGLEVTIHSSTGLTKVFRVNETDGTMDQVGPQLSASDPAPGIEAPFLCSRPWTRRVFRSGSP